MDSQACWSKLDLLSLSEDVSSVIILFTRLAVNTWDVAAIYLMEWAILKLEKSVTTTWGLFLKLLANSVDPDQTAPSEQSDLGLHSLLLHFWPKLHDKYRPMSLYWFCIDLQDKIRQIEL